MSGIWREASRPAGGVESRGIGRAEFAELVESHHADLVRLAYAMTGDVELANDIAQTTWASAWQHRAELRDRSRARSWLLTIAANRARSALRRQRLVHWLPLGSPRISGELSVEDVHSPDLVAALQRLAPRDRRILGLRYGLGETSAEIGRQVGLSDSGVRVRISRLLPALREELGDE